MSRVQNSGFYKLKFLVTPSEFQGVVELLQTKQARFHQTGQGQPQEEAGAVVEAYETYYGYFTAQEKPDYYPHFVFSIVLSTGEGPTGLFVRHEGLAFPDGEQWAEDELPYLMLSFPKGYRMDEEDGKTYRYEDIRVHQPRAYGIYEEVAHQVKGFTKPLRFIARTTAGPQEQKPPVRISKVALDELSQGWLWKRHQLATRPGSAR
ncbi:hypothetical protein [Paenibacillus daejeonensis]|uniref:hypothetical protein n=1 Tax=Paenibacillus daejeonensis TaxID=135193 RepID=UPI000366BDD9|nr:hypothetical protein [Paenibacillus daejeonensis]